MKNRQYSVKVLETTVDDENQFIDFFDTNHLLFKDHLILLKGEISDKIRLYLKDKSLTFLENEILPLGRSRKALEEEISLKDINREQVYKDELEAKATQNDLDKKVAQTQIDELSKKLENKFMVLDNIVRSGVNLDIDGDLLVLNRVNSGAMITTSGNLIITQVVEGSLRCNGNFMMMTVSPKANVIFHGVAVDNSLLEDKLNRIELKNSDIYITPVIKKDMNWV